MDVAGLIRTARQRAGLSQVELAGRAGTSQPTLARYEAGELVPRLPTLARLLEASGHELDMQASPKVRRGAEPIATVAREIRRMLHREGGREGERAAWRRLLDFVDDIRGSARAGQAWLVHDRPPPCGDTRIDAAIAGVVEMLCDEAGLPWPGWTDLPDRFVEPWWFVAGLPGFEAMALRDSPIELKRHGVFVNERAFARA